MFTAVLVAAAAVTLVAPVPKAADQKMYFPVVVGTKRVYTSESNGVNPARGLVTQLVTKAEEKDGKYVVTVEQDADGRAGPTQEYEVSANGVFVRSLDGVKHEPPLAKLKLSAKAGERWETGIGKATATMGKEEEVEVPAGKFKAIRVDMEYGNSRQKTSVWYAPDVGIVKQVISSAGRAYATELQSFTPGAGEPMKK